MIQTEAPNDLVQDARLAGAAGSREAEHRSRITRTAGFQASAQLLCLGSILSSRGLQPADQPCNGQGIFRPEALHLASLRPGAALRALVQNRADHALEPEAPAVLGAEEARDTIGVEFFDLLGDDGPPAAAEDPDVFCAQLAQAIHQVAEELEVSSLVGGDRDGVGVLLDRGRDDLVDGAIVTQMNHLGALSLEDAPHDVDGGIVTVEQRRGGHQSNGVRSLRGGRDCGGGHWASSIRLAMWSRYLPMSSRRSESSRMRWSSS